MIESYKKFIDKYRLHNCVICPILFDNYCVNISSINERIKKHFICPNDKRYINKGIVSAMCTWINYIYYLDYSYKNFKFNLTDKNNRSFHMENKFKIKYVRKI